MTSNADWELAIEACQKIVELSNKINPKDSSIVISVPYNELASIISSSLTKMREYWQNEIHKLCPHINDDLLPCKDGTLYSGNHMTCSCKWYGHAIGGHT